MIKKILYFFFSFIFFSNNALALCLTDKVDFGDSFSTVVKKLNVPGIYKPLLGFEEGKELSMPGDLLCDEEAFERMPVTFVFIEDQLVEIKGLKIGIKKLDLLDWLEKEFGSVEKEIKDLNTTAPAAEFYWDKTLLDIFYGMRRSNNETYQFMTVTHKRYAQLFNKHREEEEKK